MSIGAVPLIHGAIPGTDANNSICAHLYKDAQHV